MLLALGAHALRRAFLRSFFIDGAAGAAPDLPELPAAPGRQATGLERAARVRVVILDGLGRDTAATLPTLSALCGRGLELVVDSGFPTVSLPVQHVLFTGLTQQQSGIEYRIDGLAPPLADSIPAQLPQSAAVVEAHLEIARSFGFAHVAPSQPPPRDGPWRRTGFAAAAVQAARSRAPLVLVHILRIDEAGHRHGARSPEYKAAAQSADALLGQLFPEDAGDTGDDALWFLLSDHGHLPGGGHADAEPSVRLTRGCVVAAGAHARLSALAGRPPARVHLVDVARALAEATGTRLRPGAVGRPLPAALADPAPSATLPHPAPARWLLAGLVLLAGAGVGARAGGPPLWLPLSYLAVALWHGVPTLSCRIVYPPLGLDTVKAALPGAVLLLGVIAHRTRAFQSGVPRCVLGQLVLPLAAVLAALILCGGAQRLLGLTHEPPLVPYVSGHAGVLLSLLSLGALAGALAALAGAVRSGCDPRPRAGTGGTGGAAPRPSAATTPTDPAAP